MKIFQTILLAVSGFFIVIAVIVFSTSGRGGGTNTAVGISGNVVMWGTLSNSLMTPQIALLEDENESLSLTYIQKNPETYDEELLSALASGTGPDLFFVTDETLLSHKDKLHVISFESFAQRDFTNTYADVASIFLNSEGIQAIPFMIDPLLVYYNRDLLASNFRVNPPEYWDDYFKFSEDISRKSERIVTQSAVALGAMNNVSHGKELLSLLTLQAGNPIVRIEESGLYTSTLDQTFGSSVNALESAINYVTSFSDPESPHYSWNASLDTDRELFIAGDLAVYFGYASEITEIRRLNPNLNFDIAYVPQIRDARYKSTVARITGLGISKMSQNKAGAYSTALNLSRSDINASLATSLKTAPVLKQLLEDDAPEPLLEVTYNSGIISRAWWDPDAEETLRIMTNAVNTVNSGISKPSDAVETAQRNLTLLLSRYNAR